MIQPQFRSAPISFSLIFCLGATYLLDWFQMGAGMLRPLAFNTAQFGSQPWTIVTHSVIAFYTSFIFFLLAVLWIWSFCASVEVELGAGRFGAFFAGYTVFGALCVWAGSQVANLPWVLVGPLIPASAITVAWCARHPNAVIRLMVILPVAARWLALIVAGALLFSFPPMIGIFAVIPVALAWFWGSDRLPIPYATRRKVWDQRVDAKVIAREEAKKQKLRDEAFDRQKEREERERLRQLFEGSIRDDSSEN